MAKLTILALLALFALAHVATAFRTTVTTTVVEDEEGFQPGQSEERCRQQIQKEEQLSHCQLHLKEKARKQSFLMMTTDEEERENPHKQEQYLEQCCQQLRNLDEQCRCQGIKEAVEEVKQEETREEKEGQSEERKLRKLRKIIRSAEILPLKCNVSPRFCPFRPRMPTWF